MNSYVLVISNIAEEELESIVNYTTTVFGERQTIFYLGKIFDALYKIQLNKDLGHSRSDLPIGFLCFNVEQHCIIYSINQKRKRINIVRILHAKMDFSQKF